MALSSAPQAGQGCSAHGRAILRLSGPAAFRIAEGLLEPPLENPGPRRRWRRSQGWVQWRAARLPVVVYWMAGPRSYTRQDVVEFHLPAAGVFLEGVLGRLREAGCRPAGPGEFTRRALLNGRISAAQAEQIGALIRAERATEARWLAGRAAGHGERAVGALRARVRELLALCELGLDFSQEDVVILSREELARRMQELGAEAETLRARRGAEEAGGRREGEAPRAVLAGLTNAGKSTLFNRLLGREQALVSPERHTTRDALQGLLRGEGIQGGGGALRLFDTAGAGAPTASHSGLLGQAWEATERLLRSAEVVVMVLAARSGAALEEELAFAERVRGWNPGASFAVVWAKSELAGQGLAAGAEAVAALEAGWGSAPPVQFWVSARTGAGVGDLLAWLGREGARLGQTVASVQRSGEVLLKAALERGAEALRGARLALERGLGEDAVAVELREAAEAMAQAEGLWVRHDALTEALLDRIFSGFCIGK